MFHRKCRRGVSLICDPTLTKLTFRYFTFVDFPHDETLVATINISNGSRSPNTDVSLVESRRRKWSTGTSLTPTSRGTLDVNLLWTRDTTTSVSVFHRVLPWSRTQVRSRKVVRSDTPSFHLSDQLGSREERESM